MVGRISHAVVGVFVTVALADPASAQQFLIVSASHQSNELLIRGGTFGSTAKVFLDLAELPVISRTVNEIRATLANPEPGSHLLIVYQPPTQLGYFTVTFGTSGPQGPPGPSGPQGPGAPTIVDANGTLVGTYTGGVTTVTTLIQRGGGFYVAALALDGPIDNVTGLYYRIANCVGVPHVEVSNSGTPASPGFARHVYVWNRTGHIPTNVVTHVGSYWRLQTTLQGLGTPPPGTCTEIPAALTQLAELEPLDFSQFVPPFKIQ